ncbi:protein of unknown function [Bradyrhizobium vignae]|uniref:Uncharacterized protein n=1 Tax=Bradyrhizobium vignae TaxID=1549949 RepID=A0A2U3PUE7_9BRAD|nr:protein of unknown function [Bradyrhizobium vignae]
MGVLRDSLKWGLGGCIIFFVLTTILSITGWPNRIHSDDDLLLILKLVTIGVGIAIAVLLIATRQKAS